MEFYMQIYKLNKDKRFSEMKHYRKIFKKMPDFEELFGTVTNREDRIEVGL